MPDFVRMVNDGPVFDFQQNNKKRIIENGEDAIVPWNIACSILGNPNIPDIPPANERTRMYDKIRARHNFSAGLQTEADWVAIKPKIRVFDIEDDTEIIMLIDDPDGKHMGSVKPQKAVSKRDDTSAMQRQIDRLTQQIEKLVGTQQAQPAAEAAGNTSSPTATTDGPGDEPHSGPSDLIDDAFMIPTATEDQTATVDSPQATPVGDIPQAGEDTPPVESKMPKKVAAKKVAAKKTAAQK